MLLYHILTRGVDKRKIFLRNQDYYRFVHDLFEFNDDRIINTTSYTFYQKSNEPSNDLVSRKMEKKSRDVLVHIHAFCLMPNHYHLLLSPVKEDGISKFMRKLNMGYAKYFNEKNNRSGALFEGRYKRIPIDNDRHFSWIPYYIHFNPLDLVMPEWRSREIKKYKKANDFLKTYRWSSHLDYLGIKNFPSVVHKDLLLNFFESENDYKNSIIETLENFSIEDGEKSIILE